MNLSKTIIFFSTDVHGSDRCFRKFLNAAKAYNANTLVLGGDLTGKNLILIVEGADGTFKANYMGQERTLRPEELAEFEVMLKNSGIYYSTVSPREVEELKNDQRKLDALFSRLMLERLDEWLRLAEERLGKTGVKVYLTGGNDDLMDVEAVIRKSNFTIAAEGQVVRIDEHHEMISSGYSNITPWRCPRDIPDEELGRKIEEMIQQLTDIKMAIFNLHVPPYNSGIDSAPELTPDLKPVVLAGGTPKMAPAGSKAVRSVIEKYQPTLGLHGHIHESKGLIRIGRTLCLNPGSEYSEGILRGVIVALSEKGVSQYMFTQG